MVKVRGKLRPFDPPSIFNCVDKRLIPTSPPSPRPTKRTSSGSRSIQPDEMAEWLEREKIRDNWDYRSNARTIIFNGERKVAKW